jgi:hypothetical protein
MNSFIRVTFYLWLFFLSISGLGAQNSSPAFFYPSSSYDSKRVTGVAISEGIAFTGVLIALDYLWYKHYAHSRFHYFNDNAEWMQMDKMGHATTAYNLGVLGTDVYQWAGMQHNQAIWCGGLSGLLFLSTIEAFDGFSSGWGFSGGDMLANAAGSALVVGQNLAWDQQRIQLKFSYHCSIYPEYRPDELGSNAAQRILKDYNGQSYWLSVNIYSFLEQRSSFPQWLNAAVGFGADGMTGGRKNPLTYGPDSAVMPVFARSRRLFLSADVDFRHLQASDQGEIVFFKAINFIKTPAPALEFRPSTKKLKLHPFYF